MKSPCARLLLATLLALPLYGHAQTFLAKSIAFTGAAQSQSELLTLSGLTPGKVLSKDDIEAAMHRLDESGLFSDIQYTVSSGTLTFALQPAAQTEMQHVQYGNFVWYTQEQLNAAVHARVPLFTGSVPASGALRSQVADALKSILKERGIDATITEQDLSGLKTEFTIVSPRVVVSDLKIDNIRFDSDPTLTSVRSGLINAEYVEGISARAVQGNLSYALEEIGFLDEVVGPIRHGEPVIEPTRIAVTMTGTAQPGARYTVARVVLPPIAGTVTAADLTSEHQVVAGGPPSPSLVKNTVLRLAFIFQGHGFLDAAASVNPQKDSVAHTISYTFNVLPGEAYLMRTLLFAAGISPAQQTLLTHTWKLPPGAVYDRATVDRSLIEPSVKTVCQGRPAIEELVPDKVAHRVDIRLNCGAHR